jgi:MFS family permease
MFLFIINLVMALCMNVINPLFPLFVQSLGASVFEISLVLFAQGLLSTVLMVPIGFLSDRYSRKWMIVLSTLMVGIPPFLFTFVTSWKQTIPWAMMFMGALAVFLPSRMTMIADSTEPKTRATVYGIMNLTWPMGGLIGPIIGGFLADCYGWNHSFYFVTSVSLLCLIPAFLLREPCRGSRKEGEKECQETFFNRKMLYVLAVYSFFLIFGNTGLGILNPVIPVYLTERFQASKTQVGFFFSAGLGVAILMAQIPSGLLADRYGRKRFMACCVSIIPVLSMLWPWLNDYLLLMALFTLVAGLWSTTWSASTAYLMDLTPTLKRGITIGFRQTAVRLGLTIGPLVGGYLWEAYGPAASFYASAISFAASFVLVLLLKE